MALKTSAFIRRADRDDLDTVVAWMEDPDFSHFLYGDRARSPRQVREQIIGMLGRNVNNTMPTGIYFIIDSDEHGPLGLVSLQSISWRNRSCNVDMYIGNKKFRTSYVAYISFFRLAEYCFEELNMHRIGAFIYSFNSASWRLFERSGAKRELVLHDHVPRDGKLFDLYGYGLLRSEFDVLKTQFTQKFQGMSLNDMIAKLETEEEAEAAK